MFGLEAVPVSPTPPQGSGKPTNMEQNMLDTSLGDLVRSGFLWSDKAIISVLEDQPAQDVIPGMKIGAAALKAILDEMKKNIAFRNLYGGLRRALMNAVDWNMATLMMEHENAQTVFNACCLLIAEEAENDKESDWKAKALLAIFLLMLTQYQLGTAGFYATYQDLTPIKWRLMSEWEYLDKIPDTGMTTKMLAARLELYSGSSRGLFYKILEQRMLRSASSPKLRELLGVPDEAVKTGGVIGGMVAYYKPRNDKSTCKPCRDSEGYYLPAQGPMPGQVCKGQARCRCVRELSYNPTIWQRLIDEQKAAEEEE